MELIDTPDVSGAARFIPHGVTPRPGQLETIERILDAFTRKDTVILRGATGIGKSLIAYSVARAMGSSYYLTAQKQLQDQIRRDFGYAGEKLAQDSNAPRFAELKGRSSYECIHPEARGLDCANKETPCHGSSYKKECLPNLEDGSGELCPYLEHKIRCAGARHSQLNYYSYAYNCVFYNTLFHPRAITILDEAHNLEKVVSDLVGISLTPRRLDYFDISSIDRDWEIEDYLELFRSRRDQINQRINELEERMVHVEPTQELAFLLQLTKVIESLEQMPTGWVIDVDTARITQKRVLALDEIRAVIFVPVSVAKPLNEIFFSMGHKTLLMSATIDNSIFPRTLGLLPPDFEYISVDNDWNPDHAPVVHVNVGSLSKTGHTPGYVRNRDRVVEMLELVAAQFPNDRGIIHTGSFEVQSYCLDKFSHDLLRRVLTQRAFHNDKNAMLECHAGTEGSILMAPAMTEGVDLHGDLARFQVYIKTPWSVPTESFKARAARINGYREYHTALKIEQAMGRAIRGPDDHAMFIVLDEGFRKFRYLFKRYREISPGALEQTPSLLRG